MGRRTRQRRADATATDSAEPQRVKRPRRHRRWWLLVPVLLLLGLVTVAPQLIMLPAVQTWLLRQAAPTMAPYIQIQAAHAGWLSRVQVSGLRLVDLENRTMVTVAHITTRDSLLGTVLAGGVVDEILLDTPAIELCRTGDATTNLQDWLEATASESSDGLPRLVVTIQGGSLRIVDQDRSVCQLTDISGNLHSGATLRDFTADLQGLASNTGRKILTPSTTAERSEMDPATPHGRWSLTLAGAADSQRQGVPAAHAIEIQASGVALQWPTSSIHSLAGAETDEHQMASATIDAQVSGIWPLEDPVDDASLTARATVRDLVLPTPADPTPESLAVELETSLRRDAEHWHVDTFRCISQLGRIQCQGRVPTEPWPAQGTTESNLSRLIQMSHIGELVCQLPFLTVQASGTAKAGRYQATGDLQQICANLRHFFPQSTPQASGSWEARGQWAHGAETSDWNTQHTCKLRDLMLQTDRGRPLRESEVVVSFTAAGTWQDKLHWSVTKANAAARCGGDPLQIVLREPVSSSQTNRAWPVEISLSGPADRWQSRGSWWLPADLQFSGPLHVQGRASVTRKKVHVEQATVHWQSCGMDLPDWQWREPTMQAVLRDVQYDWLGAVRWEEISLASTTVAAKTPAGYIDWSTGTPSASAQVAFRGDLSRLAYWLPAMTAVGSQWRGAIHGQAELAPAEVGLQWVARVEAPKVYLGNPGSGTVPPQSLYAQAGGSFQPASGQWQLGQLQLTTQGLQVEATARQDPERPHVWQLAGHTNYDLQQLIPPPMIAAWGIRGISGRQRHPFTLELPLTSGPVRSPVQNASLAAATANSNSDWLEQVRGEFSMGWDSLNLMGLAVSSSRLQGRFTEGILDFAEINTAVGRGRVSLRPTIDFRSTPARLILAEGQTLDHMELTAEICRGWMELIAPMLAGVTQAQGSFSMELNPSVLPLDNLQRGKMSGVLTIHEGSVGPGPLMQQVLQPLRMVQQFGGLTKAGKSGVHLVSLPEQRVPWSFQEGRVHHEGLTMRMGAVIVRTSGWVNLDHSMALVAEIPITGEWAEKKRWLSKFSGTSVRLPIRGTLSRPQVDQRNLLNLTGNAIQGAAETALQGEVQRQLKRFLKAP